MIRIPGKIPVTIKFPFWVVAFAIGYINTMDLLGASMWVLIILLSVLVHEYGHALTARFFGQKSSIELIAFGGVTIRKQVKRLKLWKEFLIVLNGPLFGFALAFIAYGCTFLEISPALQKLAQMLFYINVFWTLINLIPISPLDGGQLLSILFEGMFGAKGVKASFLVGGLLGIGFSFAAFIFKYILIGAVLFIFSLESFRMLWASRFLTIQDRDSETQKLYKDAGKLLNNKEMDLAEKKFYALRERTKKGIIYNECTSSLAYIKKEAGQLTDAYELLKPIQNELSSYGKSLLHGIAIELEDYKLGSILANDCYQFKPSGKTAFLNSKTFAGINNVTAAIGWLECALREGLVATKQTLENIKEFQTLKTSPRFQEILSKLEDEVK